MDHRVTAGYREICSSIGGYSQLRNGRKQLLRSLSFRSNNDEPLIYKGLPKALFVLPEYMTIWTITHDRKLWKKERVRWFTKWVQHSKKSFQNMSDLLMKFVGINVLSIALFKDDFDFFYFFLKMIIRGILGGPSRFVEF